MSSRTERDRFAHREGPLEFGRGPQRDVPRRVLEDPTVSTNQLYLEPQTDNTVLLRNLSAKVTIRLADGTLMEPGRELCASLPARLQIGETLVEIESRDPEESSVDAAALRTIRAPLAAGSRRADDGTSIEPFPGIGRDGPMVRGLDRCAAGRGVVTGFLRRDGTGRRRA